MSAMQQIQELLKVISPVERAQILHMIASEFDVAPGIQRTPGVCGGDARIAGTRIPVWVLVEMKRLGCNDEKLLEAYPSLSKDDLANAWEYERCHPEEIERLIFENSEEEMKRLDAEESAAHKNG